VDAGEHVSPHLDPFGTRGTLEVDDATYVVHLLDALGDRVERLPFTIKVLLEALVRNVGRGFVAEEDVEALASWTPNSGLASEVPFLPARVVLQDFTGVPCVVDLAAMRDAMRDLGGDPSKINPLVPADLVIDHSVQVDRFGDGGAFAANLFTLVIFYEVLSLVTYPLVYHHEDEEARPEGSEGRSGQELESLGRSQGEAHVELFPSPKNRSNYAAIVNLSTACEDQHGPPLVPQQTSCIIENVGPPDMEEAALT
jgi:hypothetical protein